MCEKHNLKKKHYEGTFLGKRVFSQRSKAQFSFHWITRQIYSKIVNKLRDMEKENLS